MLFGWFDLCFNNKQKILYNEKAREILTLDSQTGTEVFSKNNLYASINLKMQDKVIVFLFILNVKFFFYINILVDIQSVDRLFSLVWNAVKLDNFEWKPNSNDIKKFKNY